MTERRGRRIARHVAAAAAVVMIASLLAAGCSAQPSGALKDTATVSEADAARLPPVVLPDVSAMEPSVRQQMEERYRGLMSAVDAGAPPVQLAGAYGEMGKLLMAAEYFEAAEPCYLHAQALDAGDMRWPYYLGHVHMAKTEPAKAVDAFERALRLRPSDVATLVWLGNLHLEQGRPEAAAPRFEAALSVQPATVAALIGLGRTALATRDYATAVARFEQALSADPRASIAHYPLALAYRGLGDAAKADAHLRQTGSVDVGPPDPLMVELRGLLHGAVAEEDRGVRALDGRDFPAAVAHFRNAVELAPDNPAIRHKLGTALSLVGDTTGAVRQFEETLRRAPGFAPAHFSLGVLLAAGGRDAEAVQRLTAAVRYEPGYIEARLQLAATLGRIGQLEKALAQYRQVLAIDPRVADARFGCAMALAGLRRYGEARESLSEGARLHPDQPRFAAALARLDGTVPAR